MHKTWVKSKGQKNTYHENTNHKNVGLAVLIHPEDITTLDVYFLNNRASKYTKGRQN